MVVKVRRKGCKAALHWALVHQTVYYWALCLRSVAETWSRPPQSHFQHGKACAHHLHLTIRQGTAALQRPYRLIERFPCPRRLAQVCAVLIFLSRLQADVASTRIRTSLGHRKGAKSHSFPAICSMERCPPEIHVRIFSYACTDDGTTGCALSLVSHYFREVSYPCQWQCISLAGFKRVVRLARETQVIRRRKPVYHLFLSDRYSPPPNCYPHPEDHTAYELELLPALCTIMEYASDSLETLSFFSDACFYDGASAVRHLLSFPYPRLKELTLRACCTPRQLAGPLPGDSLPCQTPSLERLHLALPYHGFSSDNLQATHNLVQSISPSVSHLRFTMLDKWGSRRVVEVVHAELAAAGIVTPVLHLPPSDWDSPSTTVAHAVTWERLLPHGLQFFAIQPSPTSTFYCSCCMDLRGDVDVMRILERISEVADIQRFAYMDRRPIRVRKCRTDPMEVAGYGYAEAKYDWGSRIQGQDGCWRQKDAPDADVESMVEKRCHSPAALVFVPKRRTSRISKLRNVVRRFKMW